MIPFYIFTHESKFSEYSEDENKLNSLKKEYEYIMNELELACEKHVINEFTKCTLIDMLNKTLEHIAAGYPIIGKGVKDVMGGQILEYEAKTIRNEGEQMFPNLAQILLKNQRLDDLNRAATDKDYRFKLYKEFNID